MSRVAKCDFFRKRERRECNIVNDAYREVVLRHRKSEVLINADDLRRCGVFRCKAVASANNDGGVLLSVESVLDIEEQRLSAAPGSFVRSSTAMRFTVAGTAARRCLTENGR